MKRAGRIGLVAVLSLAVAVPAYAQMGSGMMQGMGSGMSPGMRGGMMGGMEPGGSMGMEMMESGKAGGQVMGYTSPLDLKDELKLTADQVGKLKPIHAEYRKAMIRKSAEVKAANIDLEELLWAKPIDYGKVEKQVKAVEALKSGLMISRVEALKKVQGVLTPEQFDKYREKARRPMGHGAGSGAGMGMMGGMGQGMMCPMMQMMMEGGMMGQGMMGRRDEVARPVAAEGEGPGATRCGSAGCPAQGGRAQGAPLVRSLTDRMSGLPVGAAHPVRLG